jgi:hypothetical protein
LSELAIPGFICETFEMLRAIRESPFSVTATLEALFESLIISSARTGWQDLLGVRLIWALAAVADFLEGPCTSPEGVEKF